MSLNYDLARIDSWQELLDTSTGSPQPITEAVIFLTIFVGMGEITSQNASEFACRVNLFETCCCPMLQGADGPRFILLADIQRHIGLRTNAAPLSRQKFFHTYVWPEIRQKVEGVK